MNLFELPNNDLRQGAGSGRQEEDSAHLISMRSEKKVLKVKVGEPPIKYFVIVTDKRLLLRKFFLGVNEKVEEVIVALSFIMSNIEGPKQLRKLLSFTLLISICL